MYFFYDDLPEPKFKKKRNQKRKQFSLKVTTISELSHITV